MQEKQKTQKMQWFSQIFTKIYGLLQLSNLRKYEPNYLHLSDLDQYEENHRCLLKPRALRNARSLGLQCSSQWKSSSQCLSSLMIRSFEKISNIVWGVVSKDMNISAMKWALQTSWHIFSKIMTFSCKRCQRLRLHVVGREQGWVLPWICLGETLPSFSGKSTWSLFLHWKSVREQEQRTPGRKLCGSPPGELLWSQCKMKVPNSEFSF